MSINICNLKIDNKGRVTLPKTLLQANGIKVGDTVTLKAMQTSNCVKMLFNKPSTNKGE
mgnify:CR=1 FL=1